MPKNGHNLLPGFPRAQLQAGDQPQLSPQRPILVVGDDSRTRSRLKRLFESEGYVVNVAADAASGLVRGLKEEPSALLLDLSQFCSETCRRITQRAPRVPVIVLSAKSDLADKVLLLEMGAHDYLTKPFVERELVARVRAAIRRSRQTSIVDVFACDGININFSTMEAFCHGRPVALTRQEFQTLKFMTANPDRVVTRAELLEEVWGYQHYPSTRTVDNHILKLRKKLEPDVTKPVHFRTVYRSGYRFVP